MIKRVCPRCGENFKAPKSPGESVRTSPLRTYCDECERLRKRVQQKALRRVRAYERMIRSL